MQYVINQANFPRNESWSSISEGNPQNMTNYGGGVGKDLPPTLPPTIFCVTGGGVGGSRRWGNILQATELFENLHHHNL